MAGFLQVFILHLLLKIVYEIQSQVIDRWMAGFLHENRTWIGLWYCYLKLIQIIPLPLRLQRPVKTGLNRFCVVFVFSNLWLTVNRTAVLTEDRSIPFAVFIGYGLVRLRFFSGFVTGLPNTMNYRARMFKINLKKYTTTFCSILYEFWYVIHNILTHLSRSCYKSS